MLAGGKEINYLMLNGEVFGSSNIFPKLYKFSNNRKHSFFYELDFDKNKNPILTLVNSNYSVALEDQDFAKVGFVLNYKNEKYALAKCTINWGSDSGSVSYIPVKAYLWIKMSEYGGGTPIAQNGGVNSPSYLLIIYNMEEATPYVS